MRLVDTRLIDPYLADVWERGGTDLLLTAGSPPVGRVDGLLVRLDGAPLGVDDVERVVHSMVDARRGHDFDAHGQLDFSFDWAQRARIRANVFSQRDTLAISMRVIPYRIPTFDELGLPAAVRRLVDLPQGLVLVTGPTGAGKTTTIASMLDVINARRPVHIVTIEEPIEYVHHHQRGVVTQREVGVDCESFDGALRSVLRQDPDVLLIGEMRDLETIQTALTVAETGHLVFATLHTNDAAQTMDRIVDVFPAERQAQIRTQLAASLQAIVAQRLLPRIGGGRVAAFEVLLATYAVRNLVREGRSNQLRNVISTGAEHGMQTMEAALSALVMEGIVDYEDAARVSMYASEVRGAPRTSPRAVS